MSRRFEINLKGIIDVLSNHLYSQPEVFIRELLQNCVDAISARRLIDPSHEGKIQLSLTSVKNVPTMLEVIDNGVGLNEEEIHRFLSTIGSTSKRDSEGKARKDFLGQFGIGLLSCFVVSDEIVVVTRSTKESGPAVEWRGKVDGTYSVRTLEGDLPAGTTVYLTLRPECSDLLKEERLEELVFHYGALLPYPIAVSKGKSSRCVNDQPVPWRRDFVTDDEATQELLAFGQKAFTENFLDAIPLRSEVGKLDGVAFVMSHPANLSSRRTHRVYLRNMLLSESADNLLPDWAFFVKAIVNADDLRPTASRESFYEDARLEKARESLGRCLRDHLVRLAEYEPGRFGRFLNVHHLALKALAVEDEECYRLFIGWLPFETNRGRMTVRELAELDQPVKYVTDVDTYHQINKVASAQGVVLVNAGYVYEADLISQASTVFEDISLEQWETASVANEFGELTDREHDQVSLLMDVMERVLRPFSCRPEFRKFQPAELHSLFYADPEAKFMRSVEQSREVADSLFQGILGGLAKGRSQTPMTELVVNFGNPLVQTLCQVKDVPALEGAVKVIYVQSLLMAQQPLTSREMTVLNDGLAGLVTAISTKD